MLHNIEPRSNDNGSNTCSFQCSGRQTDGLMTNWSQRYKQGNIDSIFPTGSQDSGGVIFNRVSLTVFSRNKMIAVGNFTDYALFQ